VTLPGAEAEFPFELAVCRWAEREWPPGGERGGAVVVARQLGTQSRRWDTVVLECDLAGLTARAAFGEGALSANQLHVVRHAPADWTYYRDALPDPGYPWRYVRESVHALSARGALEHRKRGGRIEIRRIGPYPEDWVRRVVAVENKPDLDRKAADALADQLERDVALSLADEAWVATRASDDVDERLLLEDLPVEAGILAVADAVGTDADRTNAEVVWHPRSLAVDDPGTRVLENPDPAASEGYDASAARFEYADAEWKREKRLALAERAYERGWRSYVDAMRADCRHFELRAAGAGLVPWCAAKERCQTSAECRGSCDAFEPEPPTWRQHGWPIEGGPAAGARRVLDRRRERRRPDPGDASD